MNTPDPIENIIDMVKLYGEACITLARAGGNAYGTDWYTDRMIARCATVLVDIAKEVSALEPGTDEVEPGTDEVEPGTDEVEPGTDEVEVVFEDHRPELTLDEAVARSGFESPDDMTAAVAGLFAFCNANRLALGGFDDGLTVTSLKGTEEPPYDIVRLSWGLGNFVVG